MAPEQGPSLDARKGFLALTPLGRWCRPIVVLLPLSDKEPWDNTSYFRQQRQRSPQLADNISDRLLYKQVDR